jgi:hypothetical protein
VLPEEPHAGETPSPSLRLRLRLPRLLNGDTALSPPAGRGEGPRSSNGQPCARRANAKNSSTSASVVENAVIRRIIRSPSCTASPAGRLRLPQS